MAIQVIGTNVIKGTWNCRNGTPKTIHEESNSAQIWPPNSTRVQTLGAVPGCLSWRCASTDPGDSCLRTQGNTWIRRKGATPSNPISSPRNHAEADCQNSLQWIA